VVLRQTPRAVTPYGGLGLWIEFLHKIGFSKQLSEHLPIRLESPNAIEPAQTFTAFLMSVLAGARRFAHASLLRADRALHALLGMERFPTDGTIRNLFKRFTRGMVVRFYEPLWAWQLAWLPKRTGGYSLDLDSTVFERYGEQEGVKKGYNPRKPGRGSHHPLLGVLGAAYFILHGWLRSGSGFYSYLGTKDLAEVEQRIDNGDGRAALVFDAMAYQIAKEIGAMATVLLGRVDALLITGGMAHSARLVAAVQAAVGWIAPVAVYPGKTNCRRSPRVCCACCAGKSWRGNTWPRRPSAASTNGLRKNNSRCASG